MAKSKFFRVAVEGQTTDGRVIERNWLEEMAVSYNPSTYGARVNMEHIRGFSADLPFRAYGDVLALRTETVEVQLDGKTAKKLALFAQIDPTDDLVALNTQRQKLYTSCEIAPNFAGTNKAYLVGLAITDNPASLGTEMLTFAAGQDQNPLASRKQDAANLFSAATDSELTLELEPEGEKGLMQAMTEFFARLTGEKSEPATPPPADPITPPEPVNDNAAAFATLKPVMEQFANLSQANADGLTALTATVTALSAKLDAMPEPRAQRPLASGADGYARTDC
jgi:hypothetical protein